ncbi:MAG TPA: hypothetical protein DEQ14_12065 [Treponema sp.]|nr:hypothetical protein [Treponema sp.]
MLKKRVLPPVIFLLALIPVFFCAGCDLEDVMGIDTGKSWPSLSNLSDYGLNNMPKPARATDITWATYRPGAGLIDLPDYDYPVMVISFEGNNTTKNAVLSYFIPANGWIGDWDGVRGKGEWMHAGRKAVAQFTFSWDGDGEITAGIME